MQSSLPSGRANIPAKPLVGVVAEGEDAWQLGLENVSKEGHNHDGDAACNCVERDAQDAGAHCVAGGAVQRPRALGKQRKGASSMAHCTTAQAGDEEDTGSSDVKSRGTNKSPLNLAF